MLGSYQPILYPYLAIGVDSFESALNPLETSTQTLSQTKVLDAFCSSSANCTEWQMLLRPLCTPLAALADTLNSNRTDWINQVWPTGYAKWLSVYIAPSHNFYPDGSLHCTPRLVAPNDSLPQKPQTAYSFSPPWAIQCDSVVQHLQILPLL